MGSFAYYPQIEDEEEYRVEFKMEMTNGESLVVSTQWGMSQEEATKLFEQLQGHNECFIADVQELDHQISAPKPINSVEMLHLTSTLMKASPERGMELLESLYSNGLVSYMRTRNDKYDDMFKSDLKELLRLQESAEWGAVLQRIKRAGGFDFSVHRHTDGVIQQSKYAHPPIVPTKSPMERDFQYYREDESKEWNSWERTVQQKLDESKRLMEIVSRIYSATFMKDAEFQLQCSTVSLGGMGLNVVVYHMLEGREGFLEVLDQDEDIGREDVNMKTEILKQRLDETVTKLREQGVPIPHTKLQAFNGDLGKEMDRWLSASDLKVIEVLPAFITVSGVLKLMEECGIGTDGTIPNLFELLRCRGFIKVIKDSRQVIPLPMGIALIIALEKIGSCLIKPDLRSKLEKDLTEVAYHARPQQLSQIVEEDYLHRFKKEFDILQNDLAPLEFFMRLAITATRYEKKEKEVEMAGLTVMQRQAAEKEREMIRNRPLWKSDPDKVDQVLDMKEFVLEIRGEDVSCKFTGHRCSKRWGGCREDECGCLDIKLSSGEEGCVFCKKSLMSLLRREDTKIKYNEKKAPPATKSLARAAGGFPSMEEEGMFHRSDSMDHTWSDDSSGSHGDQAEDDSRDAVEFRMRRMGVGLGYYGGPGTKV